MVAKFDFSALGEGFLETAPDLAFKIYMTREEIKQMRQKEAQLKEQIEYDRKKDKENAKLEIAKMLFEAGQKRKKTGEPLTGTELEAEERGKSLQMRRGVMEKMLRGETLTTEEERILDEASPYYTLRRVGVTTEYKELTEKGTEALGGYDQPKVTDDLTANQKARQDAKNAIKGFGLDAASNQVLVDAFKDLDDAYDDDDVAGIYQSTLAKLGELRKNWPEQQKKILIDKTFGVLSGYREMIQSRNYLESLRGGAGKPTEQPTTQPKPKGQSKSITSKELAQFKATTDRNELKKWEKILKARGYTDDEILELY